MKKEVFDAICYIPKFEQDSYGVVTKKVSFEVALFLGMEQVTKPYKPILNDGITIPMADKKTLFGSMVEYDRDEKGYGSYVYQSPNGLWIQSAKSIEKGILALFLDTVNEYLIDTFLEGEREHAIMRWKTIFEKILRCGFKKRRYLMKTNQVFKLHDNGYLIDPKTQKYIFSLDDFIIDTDSVLGSALSSMSCAEYVGRELRYDFDDMILDEYDQFEAYAGKDLFEKGIAFYATHALEVYQRQKRELKYGFENGFLKDEYVESTN